MKFFNRVLRRDFCQLGQLSQWSHATPLAFVGFAEARGDAYAKTAIFRWKTNEWAFLSYKIDFCVSIFRCQKFGFKSLNCYYMDKELHFSVFIYMVRKISFSTF